MPKPINSAPTGPYRAFAERLRELRMATGMSQRELAKRAGFSQSILQKWELGERCPREGNLRAIARSLGGASTYTELAALAYHLDVGSGEVAVPVPAAAYEDALWWLGLSPARRATLRAINRTLDAERARTPTPIRGRALAANGTASQP